MIQLDTTVLIDVLRGHEPAVQYLIDLEDAVGISVLSVAELYVGLRPGEEQALEDLIATLDVWPLELEAARRGGAWRQQYGPSHNVSLTDALLAATAFERGARLATHNLKHFPMLPEAVKPYER